MLRVIVARLALAGYINTPQTQPQPQLHSAAVTAKAMTTKATATVTIAVTKAVTHRHKSGQGYRWTVGSGHSNHKFGLHSKSGSMQQRSSLARRVVNSYPP